MKPLEQLRGPKVINEWKFFGAQLVTERIKQEIIIIIMNANSTKKD